MNRHRRRRNTFPTNLVAEAVEVTSALHGCTCRPDIERHHRNGLASVSVFHDSWCPAVDSGSQLVIARHPHDSAADFAAVIAELVDAIQPEEEKP